MPGEIGVRVVVWEYEKERRGDDGLFCITSES
jgi:hypothetical protein